MRPRTYKFFRRSQDFINMALGITLLTGIGVVICMFFALSEQHDADTITGTLRIGKIEHIMPSPVKHKAKVSMGVKIPTPVTPFGIDHHGKVTVDTRFAELMSSFAHAARE